MTVYARRLERLFYCLISAIALFTVPARCVEPAKTVIQDTLYRADSTAARGTILISWPAFSTADGKPVAAGTLSVKIGANGGVNIPLIPTQGAIPSGTAYKVVISLDDGSTSTEFWAVPALSPTTIAAIRSTQVPATVAMQVVSREYVDQQLASAVRRNGDETIAGAKTFTSSPLVPPPGTDAAAATKGYVDVAIAAAAPSPANVLNINKGGTGTNSFTPARCVRVADDGNNLESSSTDCGGANADTLDGLHASAFLGATAQASDADSVDGRHASELTNATQLQGVAIDNATPTRGQHPYFDAAENKMKWRSDPHVDPRDFGARCDGTTDDTSALQAAINSIRETGGTLRMPRGKCKITAALDFAISFSVKVAGSAPVSSGHTDAIGDTAIVCAMTTGPRCIDARSSQGFTWDGVNVIVDNPSFTGWLMDFAHSGPSDASLMTVQNSTFGGSNAANNKAGGISLDQSIEGRVVGNNFRFLSIGVSGRGAASYSNVMKIDHNQFLWITTMPVDATGEAWEISNNTFEGCWDGVTGPSRACGIRTRSGDNYATTIVGNWFGDIGGFGSWIEWSGYQLTAIGNMFGNISASYGISSIARSGNTVTVVTTAPQTIVVGTPVILSGVPDATFNGYFVVSAVSNATTFSYYQAAADASSSGGSLVARSSAVYVDGTLGANEGITFNGNLLTGGVGITAGRPSNTYYVTVSGNESFSGAMTVFDPYSMTIGGTHLNCASCVFYSTTTYSYPTNAISSYGGLTIGTNLRAHANIPITMVGETSIAGTVNLGNASARATLLTSTVGDKLVFYQDNVGLGLAGNNKVRMFFNPANVATGGFCISKAGTSGTASSGTGSADLACMNGDGSLTSTVATGAAPLVVASTTAVTNLNADMLDGKHAADFAPASYRVPLRGYCTGVAGTSQVISVAGLGATAMTCSQATAPGVAGALMTSAGTIKNLYINEGAGQKNGTSMAWTVYKNNVATALTCTVANGATTCNDITHSFTVVAGDYVSVKSGATASSSETLANVSVAMELWN